MLKLHKIHTINICLKMTTFWEKKIDANKSTNGFKICMKKVFNFIVRITSL